MAMHEERDAEEPRSAPLWTMDRVEKVNDGLELGFRPYRTNERQDTHTFPPLFAEQDTSIRMQHMPHVYIYLDR